MDYIDLHVHSTASDGTFSPKELVSLAGQAHLTAFALTDHDTTSGIKEAKNEAAAWARKNHSCPPPEVIAGIEVSSGYNGHEIHILGLYIDPQEEALLRLLKKMRLRRQARNEEMLSRFAGDGIVFTRAELTPLSSETVITRGHVARALLMRGMGTSIPEIFKTYLQYGGRYCPKKELSPPREVIGALLAAGAFVSVAHPFQYHLGDEGIEAMVREFAAAGMQGIEVFHSTHTPQQSEQLIALAAKYGLRPTGGSDFHGENKPDISIGTGRGNLRVPASFLTRIKESLGR